MTIQVEQTGQEKSRKRRKMVDPPTAKVTIPTNLNQIKQIKRHKYLNRRKDMISLLCDFLQKYAKNSLPQTL